MKNILYLLILGTILTGCSTKIVYELAEVPEAESIVNRLGESQAIYGILVQDSRGDTIFAYNEDKLLVPASTLKLVTGAAAYKLLGKDYRMPTFVGYEGFLHNNILFGDLVITGTGDPTFDSRHWQSPVDIFSDWADSLRNAGITEIRGDVIGNDDLFDDRHLGTGWAWDDLSFSYAAEFGALMADNSAAEFMVMPQEDNSRGISIIESLPLEYFTYASEITWIDSMPEHIHARRINGTNTIRLYGNYGIEREAVYKTLSTPNPTQYFATMCKNVLQENGIMISGYARDIDDIYDKPQHPMPLFTHYSPPLKLIIGQYLQYSNNQAAEAVFKHLAWHESGRGSFSEARLILEVFLDNLAIERADYRIVDASGLSRYNLVNAALLNKILLYMEGAGEFAECLGKPGGGGTLQKRASLKDLDLQAKTGSMSRIECLTGYLGGDKGEKLIITVMVNNYDASFDTRHPVDDFLLFFGKVPERTEELPKSDN